MELGFGTPVRLEGHPDPQLSRWLWLVKWFLLIPHAIVLAVLWILVPITWLAALLSILVTAHYPRGLFDYHVGLMRWSWRVGYYAYSGLGTDRYPPFTLADVPDYPARLEVAAPDRLSRGLVLIQWWLLALPHYVVLALLLGPQVAVDDGDMTRYENRIGIIGLLVLVAGIVLLVTGSYPKGLHDLVVGLDRWVYRVAAYALLMTTDYPPFRFDLGEDEPVPGTSAPPSQAPLGPAAPAT